MDGWNVDAVSTFIAAKSQFQLIPALTNGSSAHTHTFSGLLTTHHQGLLLQLCALDTLGTLCCWRADELTNIHTEQQPVPKHTPSWVTNKQALYIYKKKCR